MGADDGAVRDAGGVLGQRIQTGSGRNVLPATRPERPVRVGGAGRKGIPNRGGQPKSTEGRDLPGVLSVDPGGRHERRGGAPIGAEQATGFPGDGRSSAGVRRGGKGNHDPGTGGGGGGA